MKNEYEVRGDVTVIFLRKRDGSSVETMIDTRDFDKANSFPNRWNTTSNGYVSGFQMINKKVSAILLHRLIMGYPENKVVDHANHNRMDNRTSNLRIATTSENMQNISGNYSTNKSGYRGVYWEPERNKWRVRLKVNGKRTTVGRYDTYNEAVSEAKLYVKNHMPFSQEASA